MSGTNVARKITQTTLATTTLVPGITQHFGLAPIDILTRYPLQTFLLQRFTPSTIYADRYISSLWVPFALIGCTISAVVHGAVRWKRPSDGTRTVTSNPTNVTITRSVYLLSIAILHLIRDLFVILIDLDTAWDTGLLAWNQLICPLTHTISTASRLAVSVLTLTLGMEVLATISDNAFWLRPIRFLFARGNSKKAVQITIGLALGSGLFGLIETTYWRVQYYLPGSHFGTTHTFDVPTLPLARCEVTGQFQYLFSAKMHKLTVIGSLDSSGQPETGTHLAASYADYKWITSMTIDCALALMNICVALAIVRIKLLDQIIVIKHSIDGPTNQSRKILDIKYIAFISLVQGLCRLPEALLFMLEPLTRPGETNLTDSELELDGTWQRYFVMLTVRTVTQELADLPAALMLPICLTMSKDFRQGFCQLFGFCYQTDRNVNHSHLKRVQATHTRHRYSPSDSIQSRYSTEESHGLGSMFSPTASQRYVSMEHGKCARPSTLATLPVGTPSVGNTGYAPSKPVKQCSCSTLERQSCMQGVQRPIDLFAQSSTHRAYSRRYDDQPMSSHLSRPPNMTSDRGTTSGRFKHSYGAYQKSVSLNDLWLGKFSASTAPKSVTLSHVDREFDWPEPHSYV